MKPRKRVLFIAEAATLAHVTRPLVLARTLDPAHYEIHFACADRFPFVFENETFVRHTIQSISAERFLRSLARGAPLFDYRTLAAHCEEDQGLLKRVRPDLVVGDFRLSLAVSAPLSGIPYATITNATWSPYTRGRYPLPDLPMVPFLGISLSKLLFQIAQPVAFAWHARPLNRLRREKGLAAFTNLCHTYTHADHTLYADIPGLVPTFDRPANHHYLGPVTWSPQSQLPAWWDQVPRDRPCVYLTLGSSGRVGLLARTLKALDDMPVSIIVATANRERLGSLPDNVWASDYLPGEKAAMRSVLVICNGGSGTTYQALNAGVSMLGLPTNMDQYLNMRYVQAAGAGITLRSDRAREKEIRQAVETLLADKLYRSAACSLAEECRTYKAGERFGDLLEQWLG